MKLALASLLLVLTAGYSDGQAPGSRSHAAVAGAAPSVPLVGRVTDAAHLLTRQEEARLSAKLEKLEKATQHQMVVVTVKSLDGDDVAAFTTRLANSWGIGRKGYDDGVVLLVASKERKARIAVGYGLEKQLPDILCRHIMAQKIVPRFREGDMAGGIEAGVNALIARLTA